MFWNAFSEIKVKSTFIHLEVKKTSVNGIN